MGRHWPRERVYVPPTPAQLRAERRASKALVRADIGPTADDEYPSIVWDGLVECLALDLLRQHADPLPRERIAPVTLAELRERAHDRAWREQMAQPIPTKEHDDDIPF